jgi:hypothetical protein
VWRVAAHTQASADRAHALTPAFPYDVRDPAGVSRTRDAFRRRAPSPSRGRPARSSGFPRNRIKQAVIRLKKTLIKCLPEYVINRSHSEVRMAQAATLRPAQIRHPLAVTAATSRHPERDWLVLLLGTTCGTRVGEIAQIE